MKFLQSLSESHMLSSVTSFRRYTARQIAELVYLHVISLRILASEPLSVGFSREYASHSVRYLGFGKWYQNATDLHLLIYALLSEDVDLKMPESSQAFKETLYFDEREIRFWMKDIASGHINESRTKKLFLHMDGQFQIKDTSMKAIRRLVQDWPHNSIQQKQLTMTRLLQMMRVRARQSDLLLKLEKLATELKLELHNVNNPETGDERKETGHDPAHLKQEKKKPSFMKSLAATAAGAMLGYTAIRALSEGKIAHKGDGFVIIKNPTVQQLFVMKEKADHAEGLRALLHEGDVYAWDGMHLTHDQAEKTLGFTGDFGMHLWANYIELDCPDADPKNGSICETLTKVSNDLSANPTISRFYEGQPQIRVIGDYHEFWMEEILREDASAGATSSTAIADVVLPIGAVQRRNKRRKKK